MANLKEAASLINQLSQETQLELYKTWQSNQEAAVTRLVEIAKEKGKTGYDAVTVKKLIEEFIAEVEKNDENEDLELREEELMAMAGGLSTERVKDTQFVKAVSKGPYEKKLSEFSRACKKWNEDVKQRQQTGSEP